MIVWRVLKLAVSTGIVLALLGHCVKVLGS